MPDLLATEIETFEAHISDWLTKSKGKFALITGEEVIGFFENEMDAINLGYKQLGNIPFLVKRIAEVKEPIYYSSTLLDV